MFRLALVITLSAAAATLGCAGTNVSMDRGFDDFDEASEYHDTMSPDAFVDRMGEPDKWHNEGKGDGLRMTAIWNCSEGERREVTWRIRGADRRGRQQWQVVRDTRSEGECDEDGDAKTRTDGS